MPPQAVPATLATPSGRGIHAPRLLRALRIIHPFPTLLNGVAVIGLAFVASWGAPDGSLLLRMVAMMLCAQSAIGIVNDICDGELDAAAKPWKPLASGAIAVRTAQAATFVLIAATVALAATLGVAGFVLAMAGLGAGLAYDVRLKRSLLSPVPYMVAIPVLPLWVWASLDRWEAALWWLLPLGALVGLSLHLANTAPDIEDDLRHGVRGFAHVIGSGRATALAWASFVLALAVSSVLAPFLGYNWAYYAPTLAIGLGCVGVAVLAVGLHRDRAASPIAFGALALGSVALAVGWLAAVTAP